MEKDLKSFTLEEVRQIVEDYKAKGFLAKYIFNFIHQKNVSHISDITPVSKQLRSKLSEDGFYISHNNLIEIFKDPDGTQKFLFELPDGQRIESVLLVDGKRKTLCISTQAGCAMNCSFCATAKLGFQRNLSTAEIIDQVRIVGQQGHVINNVVYMGMGEPFMNYDNVVRSIRILNHADAYNIGIRHITVSTCGIAPAIEKLGRETIHPRLAISLNAVDDKLRSRIMPINKKYPLSELFDSIILYQRVTGQRVTFEYILIRDVNDSAEHARQLVRRISGIKCNVNLIEYNPHAGCSLEPSSKESIAEFAKVLTDSGVEIAIRFKKGQKIKAACGQLGATWLKCRKSSEN